MNAHAKVLLALVALIAALCFLRIGQTNRRTELVTTDHGSGMASASAAALSRPFNFTGMFLHGLGDSGQSWQWLRRTFSKGTWIIPTSPKRPISANNGFVMTGWFDLDDLPVTRKTPVDNEGFKQSIALIHSLLDEQIAAGVPSNSIFLFGFSQGGAMTLAAVSDTQRPFFEQCMSSSVGIALTIS